MKLNFNFDKLSMQEKLVLVTGVIAVVLLAMNAKKLKTSEMLMSSAIMLAVIYVQLYNMNCLLHGDCRVWAWITAVTISASYLIVASGTLNK